MTAKIAQMTLHPGISLEASAQLCDRSERQFGPESWVQHAFRVEHQAV